MLIITNTRKKPWKNYECFLKNVWHCWKILEKSWNSFSQEFCWPPCPKYYISVVIYKFLCFSSSINDIYFTFSKLGNLMYSCFLSFLEWFYTTNEILKIFFLNRTFVWSYLMFNMFNILPCVQYQHHICQPVLPRHEI